MPADVAIALSVALANEAQARSQPSMSAIVFDRNGVVWSGTVGHVDPSRQRAPSNLTRYRAGSISKLFTDILLIQMVESGQLSLDVPVTHYLPTFRPQSEFPTQITLRHLLSHTSGLVREPPVGSYFELGDPGSAAIVESLNSTRLVAAPGTVRKYSNAGLAVIGRLLEVVSGRDFDTLVQDNLLRPAGMSRSQFNLAGIQDDIAFAEMAPFGGNRRVAPVFDIGLKAAGGLNTTAADAARFGIALLNGGMGENGRLLAQTTLEAMYQLQPVGGATASDVGLGFVIRSLDGDRMLGHSGGIYGFTSEFWLLPDRGVGVVVFGTVDGDDAPNRFARHALAVARAERAGAQPPDAPRPPAPASAALRAAMPGFYSDGAATTDIRLIDGKLLVQTPTALGEIVQRGGRIALDSDFGVAGSLTIDPAGGWIDINGRRFARIAPALPDAAPEALSTLFGDYGWDHQYIRMFERDGHPYVMIEGIELARLIPVDRNTFEFPTTSILYARERLVFSRGSDGQGTAISLNGIIFPRRATSCQLCRSKGERQRQPGWPD
ncbi:MAG: beta-lactamase family protein [Sphingopyxis sp.]|nr:beta-lactamase family protein [Sphingopyxis sp.]